MGCERKKDQSHNSLFVFFCRKRLFEATFRIQKKQKKQELAFGEEKRDFWCERERKKKRDFYTL